MENTFNTLQELGQAEERPCTDPSCDGTAEPEQDGDHRYWSCPECGMDFGYEKVETSVIAEDSSGNCSVGVPEEIRRQASSGMEQAMAQEAAKQPIDLGLQIGKRPGL